MKTMLLEDKIVIITGGSNGIGKGIAKKFVEEGATVIIGDIDEEEGTKLEKELGNRCLFQYCNVRKERNIESLIRLAINTYGRLDVFVNNAGIGCVEDLIDNTSTDALDVSYATTFRAYMLGMKHAAKYMKEQKSGNIINITSQAVRYAGTTGHAYCGLKAGCEGLSRSVAIELAHWNIRVNCIAPAGVGETMIFGKLFDVHNKELHKYMGEALKVGFATRMPIARSCIPEDIANSALYLASELSSYVTGQTIIVDGGLFTGYKFRGFKRHKQWFNALKDRFNLTGHYMDSLNDYNEWVASLKDEIE